MRCAEILKERFPEKLFLELPPLYVATDVVPQRGSIHFRSSTIVDVLEDLGRSLCAQGFRDIWVSSFHGGPRHFLSIERAAERINTRHGGRMVSLFSMMLQLLGGEHDLRNVLDHVDGVRRDDLEGDMHGGLVETSMVLHLLRERIVGPFAELPTQTVTTWLKAKGADRVEPGRGLKRVLEVIQDFGQRAKYYETMTYAGSPAGANPALGEQFLDEIATETSAALAELLEGRRSPDDCHSPLWPLRHLLGSRVIARAFDRVFKLRNPIF